MDYYQCVVFCTPGDVGCITQCSRELEIQMDQCPCKVLLQMKSFYINFIFKSGCPKGCPCPEYECPDTAVLVLNTYYSTNVPLVIDSSGNSRQPNFEFKDETEAEYSCGVSFKNRMYIYGGGYDKKQISKIVDCSVTRVGSLAFDHYRAGCATGGDEVYLCFNYADSNDYQKCRKSANPEKDFQETSMSNHPHCRTRTAASKGKFRTFEV